MADGKRGWLITGVSTGFGRELANALLARGELVAGTLRKDDQVAQFSALAPGRSFGFKLDVTDGAAVSAVVREAAGQLGAIDVLVNNAGYGLFGAVEEIDDAESRRLMETNFFGLLNLTRAVLPLMRARRHGHIVNFSSIAGIWGIPGCGVYNASKFAVEGLSEAMAMELAPLGIKVTLVEPGGFKTNFGGSSKAFAARVIEDYAATPAGKIRTLMSTFQGREAGDPAKAAVAVIRAVEAERPPLRLVLGSDALKRARSRFEFLAKDYDGWEEVSVSTDMAPGPRTSP
jgi:NAD(P)-dependent dehydrogenase (short-subunit alcohol dehydrogenase family)